jgi:hypothetical protein
MTIERRTFIGQGAAAGMLALLPLPALAQSGRVELVVVPADSIVESAPAQWAIGNLRTALTARELPSEVVGSVTDTSVGATIILLAGATHPLAVRVADAAGVALPTGPEAVALVGATLDGRSVLLVSGSDPLGFVYAATELADRVRCADPADSALRLGEAVLERPANRVRAVARFVTSEIEDRGWLHDREMWREYLTMLVVNRFNRFSLTLGIQYDFPQEVSDVYFYFAYPFLLQVPGYNVVARGLPDEERARNLETLRFIARETVRRGLTFRLGIWTHGYNFDSPRVNYRIDGITAENHAAYCRDALALLLKSVPEITALTFRLHGESGIPEGNLTFWRTVFQAIPAAGRPIAIDLHPKGIDQASIDMARATGMPVSISPKYMGEHMGLPYHEAAIRSVDMPPTGGAADHRFALSEGTRRYTRYSYGDFLTEDRGYDVVFRLWPGTQRVLLWGDPVFAAGFGRHSGFCSAGGLEICEPLSFRGRKGSGRPGNRTGYADPALAPRYDWQKYEYTYRLFGRLGYRPDAPADVWRRDLTAAFGAAAAPDIEQALANASRILPLMAMAHGAAAANNLYWPEIYTNMSIVQDGPNTPFTDTAKPPRFATVESFDPQMFQTISGYARALLDGTSEPRVTPVELAAWLDSFAQGAEAALARAQSRNPQGAAFQRLAADTAIQAGMGRFFANKLRAGLLWEIHKLSDDGAAAEAALVAYRAARAAWIAVTKAAAVYVDDVTFGSEAWLRGHWRDRLPAIDADIAEMQRLAADINGGGRGVASGAASAVAQALAAPPPRDASVRHTPPGPWRRGQPIEITVASEGLNAARLHYRHVSQAEAWLSMEMADADGTFQATIPASYTDTHFPIQYYIELHRTGSAAIFPGLNADLVNQPYIVLRQIGGAA